MRPAMRRTRRKSTVITRHSQIHKPAYRTIIQAINSSYDLINSITATVQHGTSRSLIDIDVHASGVGVDKQMHIWLCSGRNTKSCTVIQTGWLWRHQNSAIIAYPRLHAALPSINLPGTWQWSCPYRGALMLFRTQCHMQPHRTFRTLNIAHCFH